MRSDEISTLLWENIDEAIGIIHVKFTRTRTDRDLTINSFSGEIIGTIPRNSEYVFENEKTGKPITSIKKSFGTAINRAEINTTNFITISNSNH